MIKHSLLVVSLVLISFLASAREPMAMSENNLLSTVQFLSHEVGARSYLDIPQLQRAADYIEQALRSYGYAVTRQPFQFHGRTYYNIAAEAKGADPEKEEILIIGAHYDTAMGTPGADDNASGIAGLLELARLAREQPWDRTVRFVAFCLEEPPAFGTTSMGSYAYAGSLKEEGVKVYGMISLEMIGYFCEEKGCQGSPSPMIGWLFPDKGNFISFVGDFSSRSFTRKVKRSLAKASDFPVETLNTFSSVTGIDFSDHRNFWKFGFKAFMITDTSFYRNPHYHQPEDTWEKLDYKRMSRLIAGLHEALRRF